MPRRLGILGSAASHATGDLVRWPSRGRRRRVGRHPLVARRRRRRRRRRRSRPACRRGAPRRGPRRRRSCCGPTTRRGRPSSRTASAPYHGLGDRRQRPAAVRPVGQRVVLEIEGERREAWVRGRARRLRVDSWRAGDRRRGRRGAPPARRRPAQPGRLAARRRRVRRRLARRRPPRRTRRHGVEPRAAALIAARPRQPAGGSRGAGSWPDHRRRPGPAAGAGASGCGPAGWPT